MEGTVLNKPLFPLGKTCMTPGVRDALTADEIKSCFYRHSNGDFGDICKEDWNENLFSLDRRLRIFSVYLVRTQKVYVITEADRSVTTILFASEY